MPEFTTSLIETLPDGWHRDASKKSPEGFYCAVVGAKPDPASPLVDGQPTRSLRNSGSRRFVMRRKLRWLGPNDRYFTIGPCARISLKDARDIAAGYDAQIRKGIDPCPPKKAKAAPPTETASATDNADTLVTLRDFVLAYSRKHRLDWDATTRHDFEQSFVNHVYPTLADCPAWEITEDQLLALIEDGWTGNRNRTPYRLQQRFKALFKWACRKHKKLFPLGNPAIGLLEVVPQVKKAEAEHMIAPPWREMPKLLSDLGELDDLGAPALQFLIACCGPRAREVYPARLSEIVAHQWHVPAARMKSKKARIVPLSGLALSLVPKINDPSDPSGALFPGDARGGHIGHGAMRDALRKLHPDWDVHGVRKAFKDWALENLKHPLDIPAIEIALDHTIGNKVQETYRDTNLIGHRRILAERWGCFLRSVEYVGPYFVKEVDWEALAIAAQERPELDAIA